MKFKKTSIELFDMEMAALRRALHKDDPWRVRDILKYARHVHAGDEQIQKQIFRAGIKALPAMLRATHKGAARVAAADLLGTPALLEIDISLDRLWHQANESGDVETLSCLIDAMVATAQGDAGKMTVVRAKVTDTLADLAGRDLASAQKLKNDGVYFLAEGDAEKEREIFAEANRVITEAKGAPYGAVQLARKLAAQAL